MRLSTTLETTVTVSDAGQDNLLYDQPRAVRAGLTVTLEP